MEDIIYKVFNLTKTTTSNSYIRLHFALKDVAGDGEKFYCATPLLHIDQGDSVYKSLIQDRRVILRNNNEILFDLDDETGHANGRCPIKWVSRGRYFHIKKVKVTGGNKHTLYLQIEAENEQGKVTAEGVIDLPIDFACFSAKSLQILSSGDVYIEDKAADFRKKLLFPITSFSEKCEVIRFAKHPICNALFFQIKVDGINKNYVTSTLDPLVIRAVLGLLSENRFIAHQGDKLNVGGYELPINEIKPRTPKED